MSAKGSKKNLKYEKVSQFDQLMKLSGLWQCSLVSSFALVPEKRVEFGPDI